MISIIVQIQTILFIQFPNVLENYNRHYCTVEFETFLFVKDDTSESNNFKLVSGGKPSRKCGIMASGNHMFFNEDGLRMLETIDMDLSNAR